MNNPIANKPTLIYVGDPMCSWCYGISGELEKLTDHFDTKIDVDIIMGGLRAGGGEEWNQKFQDFLRHHWEDVGIRSGQPFKFEILDWDQFDYDTEPACRAVVTIQDIDQSKALAFFKAVQKGFYLENKDPKLTKFYKPICEQFDIDFDVFAKKFESRDLKQKTQLHFKKSQQIGVRSFPTILLDYGGKLHLIASGYSTYDKMREKINEIIN